MSARRGVFHWDPETKAIVDGPAPSGSRKLPKAARRGGRGSGGISFTFPPGWDDGSGKVKHVKGGIHDGRVYFSSRREAQEIAKRYEDRAGERCRFDPD